MEYLLNTPYEFSGVRTENRIVFQPMEGCDCNEDGSPGELTIKKYIKAA